MNKYIDVIDDSKKLEQSMEKAWGRNFFFIWWYVVFFAATVVRASFNRICQIPRVINNIDRDTKVPYIRKVSNYKWLDYWNSWVDSNYWKILSLFCFFFVIAIAKTFYHIGKIIFFLWKHFIKPIMWMMVVSSAAKSIGNGLAQRR